MSSAFQMTATSITSPTTSTPPSQAPQLESSLDSALDLLRRLPPSNIGENLILLSKLLPLKTVKIIENSVDIPLEIAVCPQTKGEFLCSPLNRISPSTYRSPWTHQPENENHKKIEILAQDSFSTFRQLYYDGGITSVFVLDDFSVMDNSQNIINNTFILAILIKNIIDNSIWDSIHICTVKPMAEATKNTFSYSLNSTILLHFGDGKDLLLSGSVCKESTMKTITLPNESPEEHVISIGRIVEEVEGRLRSEIQEIYFGRTHDLINDIRDGSLIPEGFLRNQQDLAVDIDGSSQCSNKPSVMVLPPIPFFQPGQSPKDILRQINEQKKQAKAISDSLINDGSVIEDSCPQNEL